MDRQQQGYMSLSGVSYVPPLPMHYQYNPPDYNLTNNINYLDNGHLVNSSYHHQMNQPTYGIPSSPAYSYASSGQTTPSYTGSPSSSESHYSLSQYQQSPVQTPSPPPLPSNPSSQMPTYDWPLNYSVDPRIFMDVTRSDRRRIVRCTCPNCLSGREVKNGKGHRVHNCHFAGCDKAYAKTSHLKAHIRIHTGAKPNACPWDNCGRRFNRSDELKRHLRIHTGEKRHLCPTCGKGFTRSDHKQKHEKTHENQKKRKARKEATVVPEDKEDTHTAKTPEVAADVQTQAFAAQTTQQPALLQQTYPMQLQQHQQGQYYQQPLMQLPVTYVAYQNNFAY